MRILIATDAWHPQVNGVVRTYQRLIEEGRGLGVDFGVLAPRDFRSLPCPGYPEIRLALPSRRRIEKLIAAHNPDHIHIATEGPIGWMVRGYCLARGLCFTTSYHTKFPEYAASWLALPERWTYGFLARFHGPSAGVMVATPSLAADLASRGFAPLMLWGRGVDAEQFRPRCDRLFGSDAPVFLYVGRVSREKNIEAFLAADLPGRKVVVGDGPHLLQLRRRYPGVHFAGQRTGDDLARAYASADVFVFSSLTDTFGLVLLEALASGLPVAAYPVTGPRDVVEDGRSGILDWDLAAAARRALTLDRDAARARAMEFSWRRAAELFIGNVRSVHDRCPTAKSAAAGRTIEPPGAMRRQSLLEEGLIP